jgi:hypothetical protein
MTIKTDKTHMELLLDSLTNFKPKVLHCNICVITVSIFFLEHAGELRIFYIKKEKRGTREPPKQ